MKGVSWDIKQEEEVVVYHKMVECLARRMMQLNKGVALLHFVQSIMSLVCGQGGGIAPLLVVMELQYGCVIAQKDDTEVLNVQSLKRERNAT